MSNTAFLAVPVGLIVLIVVCVVAMPWESSIGIVALGALIALWAFIRRFSDRFQSLD